MTAPPPPPMPTEKKRHISLVYLLLNYTLPSTKPLARIKSETWEEKKQRKERKRERERKKGN